jgi:hypothetical protein
MGLFGNNAAEKEAKRQRRMEDERQGRIRSGTNKINYIFGKNFDEPFFAGRRDAYTNFATPQLNDQHKDANEQLTFDLARRGLIDSSTRADKTTELGKLYSQQKQGITDKAREYEAQTRNDVEDSRSNLLSTLSATGDAQGAARGALARADALSTPPAYSPLSDMFLSFTEGLGTQAGLERAAAAGSPMKPRYNLGLYGNNGAVKVTR